MLVDCTKCKKEINVSDKKCVYCGIDTPSKEMLELLFDERNGKYYFNKLKMIKTTSISIIAIVCLCLAVKYILVPIIADVNIDIDNDVVQKPSIPMTDAHENGRYFLHQRNENNGITTIIYERVGNETNVFGEMEINCKKNRYRKVGESTTGLENLTRYDAKWIKPDQGWTDQDIVEYICKS